MSEQIRIHAGIVYASQGTPIGTIIRGVVLVVEILDRSDMRDHVEFI